MRTLPWIGVDLDGTLAVYNGWKGYSHIGDPIPEMIKKIMEILDDVSRNVDIKIFTARLCDEDNKEEIIQIIKSWCLRHIGCELEITNVKDFGMIELWDDRCRRVIENTGQFCCEK